jgi:hypothetical protein
VTPDGQTEGAWVFLSHSHEDLDKVGRIRNALEGKGHNPLMFFLKCLNDDSELDDLIRREIEARTWFILCDSPNAKTSRWVQEEVEIIRSLEGKVYKVIDLDDEVDAQVERATALSKRAKVFISYTRTDAGVAEALRTALREHDFRVFDESLEMRPEASTLEAIARGIEEAVQDGFFLLLLSPNALDSIQVEFQVRHAFGRGPSGRNIIPVIVHDPVSTLDSLSRKGLSYLFDRIYFFDLTAGDPADRIAELITSLKTREME